MRFLRFFVFFIALVATASILVCVLDWIEVLLQSLPFLLSFLIYITIGFTIYIAGEKIAERLSIRVAKANPDELQREDDVLLQAVAFSFILSQRLLLFKRQ